MQRKYAIQPLSNVRKSKGTLLPMLVGIQPPCFMVPYDKPEPFVGRDAFLQKMRDELCNPNHDYHGRLALHGLGGVGKTHAAIGHVYLMKSYYHSVFWINAFDSGTVASGFQQIARKKNAQMAYLTVTSRSNQQGPRMVVSTKQVASCYRQSGRYLSD